VIVRWGLVELPSLLAEVGIENPFVIASPRWRHLELPAGVGLLSEVPSESTEVPDLADGVLAVGGGSAIDTGKHASADSGLPVVHVPTTYSGAEWTTFYGIRSPDRRITGGGAGAQPVGILYDVDLTLGLPRAESAGTALNGLAHCAEAVYVAGRSLEGDEQALAGARLIAAALPRVLADGTDRAAREELLRGAMHAGHALGLAGLGLAHAMAQALGGAYGIPHGAMNALCLRRSHSTARSCRPRSSASARRLAATPWSAPGSWRSSGASSGSATSRCPRLTCRTSRRRPRPGPAIRPTRAPRPPARSCSCSR
jgi:maleylacetate reductase